MTIQKILILRFSSIGDIVLTTPVVRCLRKKFPNAEIHYATKKSYASILENNPYITKVHILEKSVFDLVKSLKSENFDFVVDLHHNLKTLIIKTLLGKPSKSFHKLNILKYLLVNFKINKMPRVHIVDRYMKTVEQLGVVYDLNGLDYFIPSKDEVEKNWLPESHRNGFIAFAIGGQHATKKLPIDKIIHLCDQINKPIILLGGKEDIDTANEIEAFFKPNSSQITENELKNELNKKTVIFNGAGKFNLNQSASILKQAKAVFTHDTGLMHIAAAFQKEIFSIWGNTTPDFGMYPFETKFTIFENNNLSCRPCSKIGHNSCPKGHFKCMNDQKFDFFIPDWK